LTINGCCGNISIREGIDYITFGNHAFKITVHYCEGCGQVKATSRIKESKMTGENIIVEKAGKTLRAEYFKTNNGSGIRCFINEEFIQEEIYEGKSIAWAESAATNWTTGVKKLNG